MAFVSTLITIVGLMLTTSVQQASGAYACSVGYYKLKANLSAHKCSNKLCVDSVCCEGDSTKCASHNNAGCSTAGKYNSLTTVGSDEATCCTGALGACGSAGYTCPANYQDKTGTNYCKDTSTSADSCKDRCCQPSSCAAIQCNGRRRRFAKAKTSSPTCSGACTHAECCDEPTTCAMFVANGGSDKCGSYQTAKATTTSCTDCGEADCCESTSGLCLTELGLGTFTCDTDYEVPPSKWAVTGNTKTACCEMKISCDAASAMVGGAVSAGIAGSVLLLVAFAVA